MIKGFSNFINRVPKRKTFVFKCPCFFSNNISSDYKQIFQNISILDSLPNKDNQILTNENQKVFKFRENNTNIFDILNPNENNNKDFLYKLLSPSQANNKLHF